MSGAERKSHARPVILVSVVVAIALVIGGGIWSTSSSGADTRKADTASAGGGTDDKGGDSGGAVQKASTVSKVLFRVPAPAVENVGTVSTTGSWLTDTVYAKTGIAEIVGYDPDNGTELWTIKLPGPVCQGSDHVTDDNRTAITYQPAMPTEETPSYGCSRIAAIDLDAGRKLWTRTVDSGDGPISFGNVTVGAGTVAVGGTGGGAALDLASGEQLWAPKPSDTCYDAGYGGGPKLVAVRVCGTSGVREIHVQTVDPTSGKVISAYEMPAGLGFGRLVSTDPLVVGGASDLFSIDNRTGRLRARIPAADGRYVVGDDRIYLPTEEHDGTNEIVAIDLVTGKRIGRRADAGDGYTLLPLRMAGTKLIAYKRPSYDRGGQGGQIVSIDGGTFKETVLLENLGPLPDDSEILYARGNLYVSAAYAGEAYLAVAFGAS
ncbi:PQQ-like beta-propeller repeat protein [Streptomyces fulvoviolaceus]|nr:PQQ-binding-like beta-propeller repeat protein [Streptomyces fulvoviolaceus]MCT9079914.1 PQQ-like beta-propeller repeat protein [Streptomyces fulvoviolaceus]